MPLYEFEGKRPALDDKAFVHPQASIIGDVEIGPGCYVGPGAVIRGDIGSIKIGYGSNVQDNCVLHTFPDQMTLLHPNTHIGHGSILHGCEICSYVLIGMGSIIGDGAKINSKCLLGAGSFVPGRTEIPGNSVLVGSPAKVIKSITAEQLESMEYGLAHYQELAARYLASFKEIS